MREPRIELTSVSIKYGALRPLRIERLTVLAGERVALLGLDQPAAEVLINLITGAGLPDSGEVRVFGRATASITEGAEWLVLLDRFGIVSERAALLDSMTALQNLAVPFSLQIEPPDPDVLRKAAAIAREVGLPEAAWNTRVGEMGALSRMRIRLARALAFDPGVLLLEHPSAGLPGADVRPFAEDIYHVAEQRGLAALTITADANLAAFTRSRTLVLEPATGRLINR